MAPRAPNQYFPAPFCCSRISRRGQGFQRFFCELPSWSRFFAPLTNRFWIELGGSKGGQGVQGGSRVSRGWSRVSSGWSRQSWPPSRLRFARSAAAVPPPRRRVFFASAHPCSHMSAPLTIVASPALPFHVRRVSSRLPRVSRGHSLVSVRGSFV